MLDTAVVNDTKTVDVEVAEFIVTDKLSYLGELYKQIEQLDFSKPVLEALLRYEEPAIETLDLEFADKLNKSIRLAEKEKITSISTAIYKPAKHYLNKESFIKDLMDAYTDPSLAGTNQATMRIMKGITYRIAALMYNFMSLQPVKAPVNQMYFLKYADAACSVMSTVTELKHRNIFAQHDAYHFNDATKDRIIELCSYEFENYILNHMVEISHKVSVDNKFSYLDMTAADIVSNIADLRQKFVSSTGKDCDYIIISTSTYFYLTTANYISNSKVPTLFGKPIFGIGDGDSTTFGINPNGGNGYISGFPMLLTDKLINSHSVINPMTFSPTIWVSSRHTIEVVGDVSQSIITFTGN